MNDLITLPKQFIMLYPKIRELRILHDYKQEYIAGQLGISQPEYSRMENGHRHARIEDLRRLCTLYKVSMSTLMFREPEESYTTRSGGRASSFHREVQVSALLAQQEELIAHLLEQQHQTDACLKEILRALGRDVQSGQGKRASNNS